MCSVLDSLEREYKREDVDWSSLEGGGGAATGATDLPGATPGTAAPGSQQSSDAKAAFFVQLITKHQEQKEAFLKACTLARR